MANQSVMVNILPTDAMVLAGTPKSCAFYTKNGNKKNNIAQNKPRKEYRYRVGQEVMVHNKQSTGILFECISVHNMCTT